MKAGSLQLAGPFQLSNGGVFQSMTSNFNSFMTGTGSGTTTHAADVKQAIGSGDQPGAYSVAITFTGAVS